MTNFTFNSNIPAANNDPSDDHPLMLINNQSDAGIWNVDHIGYNATDGGFHTVIHQKARIGDPTIVVGANQLYVKTVTPDTAGGVADTQLFTRTGNGGVSQLTGSSSQPDGWQWVGGTLIQWGEVNLTTGGTGSSSHRVGIVTFKNRQPGAIPFPNNCWMVTATSTNTNPGSSVSSLLIAITAKTNLTFTWYVDSSSSSILTDFPSFYWIAVGN